MRLGHFRLIKAAHVHIKHKSAQQSKAYQATCAGAADRTCENPVDSVKSEPRQQRLTRKQQPRPPTLVTKSSSVDPTADTWANAALLIDKQRDWTSFDICGKLRGLLRTRKIGHAGTLDPNATGLLIVCVNKGTKGIENFVGQEKEYEGTMKLGEATLSYDADLPVCQSMPWQHITDEMLQDAAEDFTGDLMQVPPMYSAVKVKGERLYHAARRGEVVEREARPIKVSTMELARSPESAQVVAFRVVCSKGTYIRSLVSDLNGMDEKESSTQMKLRTEEFPCTGQTPGECRTHDCAEENKNWSVERIRCLDNTGIADRHQQDKDRAKMI